MSTPISGAGGIPVNDAQPVLTYGPFTMQVPGRLVDLQVKVSMPETGDDLPVILMSHGTGWRRSCHRCAAMDRWWTSGRRTASW